MTSPTVKHLRGQILDLVDPKARGTVGHLIDALVGWSRAAGFRHEPPTGPDPVLKYRPDQGGAEAWAIYPSAHRGGAKLTFVPGLTDHAGDLRRAVTRLAFNNSDLGAKKLDLPLAELAMLDDWEPIFECMELAEAHLRERGRSSG